VAESWERIERWYAEHIPDRPPSLAPAASETTITEFESEIGANLPEEFKESVRIHDGGGWWVPWRHGELLSLAGVLAQWRMYSEWQAKGDYATNEWTANDIKGPIKPVFWNKKRIYVTDNSGDHVTLDLDPPPEGRYGQVLYHSHEVGPREVLATSWAQFLSDLAVDLESGKYIYYRRYNQLELLEEFEKG
jgi:cell wall assembly regulator SMI1